MLVFLETLARELAAVSLFAAGPPPSPEWEVMAAGRLVVVAGPDPSERTPIGTAAF